MTSNLQVRDQLNALQTTARALAAAQLRLTTGKKLQTGSDDPVGARDVMVADGRLRAITQYRRGLESARARIAVQDNVLDQVSKLLTRAQELAVATATDTVDAAQRQTVAAEADELLNQLTALANTKVENDYLFGGHRVSEAPFTLTGSGATVDYTTTGATGDRPVEIDAGRVFVPTDDGATLFLDTGVMDAMRDLVQELHRPATSGHATLRAAGRALTSAFDRVQERIGSLGARSGTLDLVAANLDAFEGSLTAQRSAILDVDVEQAAVDLVSRQNAYQSALLASSKVLGLNLSDYLR
ncbi:MAG: flagellar hook-associated protein FlgL [Gemmatimonadaceae bacterium]|nr:flagellar hook-associated protein FlgL [Gemmatimonadaceae bacterium]